MENTPGEFPIYCSELYISNCIYYEAYMYMYIYIFFFFNFTNERPQASVVVQPLKIRLEMQGKSV